jgi:hypothetical protein
MGGFPVARRAEGHRDRNQDKERKARREQNFHSRQDGFRRVSPDWAKHNSYLPIEAGIRKDSPVF